MDNSWNGFQPSPIEFMHGLIMDKWHKLREERGNNDINISVNGRDINNIVVSAKRETYEKYLALNLEKAVPNIVLGITGKKDDKK